MRHERLESGTDGWRRLRCPMPTRPRTDSSQRAARKKAASKAMTEKNIEILSIGPSHFNDFQFVSLTGGQSAEADQRGARKKMGNPKGRKKDAA